MQSEAREQHIEALKNAIRQNEQAVALMRALVADVEKRRAQSAQKHPANESKNPSENRPEQRSLAA